MSVGHHGRVDAHTDFAGLQMSFCDTEELDRVAESSSDCDVVGRDAADSLVVDVARDNLRTESNRRQDGSLGTCIEALDIGSWVTFRKPETLSFCEGSSVVGSFFGHLREDEVGRAIDDSHHTQHGFAAQTFSQCPHNRNSAGNGRLEQQIHSRRIGSREQIDSDIGQEFLVGGHHWLTCRERGRDQLASRFDSTDDLDHQIDVRIGDHRMSVPRQKFARNGYISITGQVADRHSADLE